MSTKKELEQTDFNEEVVNALEAINKTMNLLECFTKGIAERIELIDARLRRLEGDAK